MPPPPPGVVDPGAAVAHAVDDMIVAGVDHLAGHQVGDEQVPRAGVRAASSTSSAWSQRAQCQPPSTGVECRQDRQVTAAAALAMAEVVVVAEPALEPARVLGDARRRPGGVDHAAGLGEQPLGGVAVGADPLDMQVVGVLADRDVHGAGQPGQVHVDLHLRPVLRLGLGDALGDELAEALQPNGS